MRPHEQLQHPEFITTRNCGKGVSKMFWAAFSYERRTSLVPLNGDPLAPRGGVTARRYLAVLEEYLPTILNDDSIFMQDGAGIHRAHIIRNFFLTLGVNLMRWPPYSPDLNPIENLWSILKQAIYERYPDLEHAPNTDDTLDRLIDAAIEVWEDIELRVLHNLSDSMPRRVAAVIAACGWYTKY
jgi:transposase